MKLIEPLNGFAAFRESLEEYQPKNGSLPQDIVELVRATYEFQVFPLLTPGHPPPAIFNFGVGKLIENGEWFTINQLVMTQDGDIAATISTDQADRVLDDLMRVLDDNLGFRLRTAKKIKRYASNVVVEFDEGIEKYISKLSRMADVINELRPGMPRFNIKRIVFGEREPAITNDPLGAVEQTDFLIERRANRQYEENRYFCSAPMSTSDHIRALEQIEAIARG